MWLARAWSFLNCPDAVPALFKKRKRERKKPNLKKPEENFLPIVVFCKQWSFLLPSPSTPDEAGDENGSFVPFPGAQVQRECSGNSSAGAARVGGTKLSPCAGGPAQTRPGDNAPSRMGAGGLCGAGDEAPMPFFLQEQARCKPTGAEKGEVGVSGHVVLVGADHGLGGSGLLAFPKVGICSPMEAGSIPLGACSDALAPALGCSLRPSSPVFLVL